MISVVSSPLPSGISDDWRGEGVDYLDLVLIQVTFQDLPLKVFVAVQNNCYIALW